MKPSLTFPIATVLFLSSIRRYDTVNFGGAEVEGVDPNRSFFNLVDIQSLQFAPPSPSSLQSGVSKYRHVPVQLYASLVQNSYLY